MNLYPKISKNQLKSTKNNINAELLTKTRKEGILVDTNSLRTGVLFRNANILKNSNSWHAFVLHCFETYERNEILKIVLDHVYPLDLVPVKFESRGKDCMFIARNCTEAIEKLCKDQLMIPNPEDQMSPIRCEIILQYSTLNKIKVDIQKNISNVLHSLYNVNTRTLSLENFSNNPDLMEYCPLSQPKIMYFVLHLALGMHPVSIKLCKNEIHSLFPLEALWSSTSLIHLDLRNNKIDNASSLESMKMLKLTELWLDGNPFCNDKDEYVYVNAIKDILPKLDKLDGVTLPKNGAPLYRRNFLCDSEGFDLVDQFMEYFFPTYDTDRRLLEGLYHPNAMYSITNLYKNGQSSSSVARLRPYQVNSRNLLAMADISRSQQYLVKGNIAILRMFLDLPRCEHDPYSLSVDLIYYSKTTAVITATGVFREIPNALLEPERYLGFCRTFVLTGSKGEYVIMNDMLHVYNALTSQVTKAFTIAKQIKNEKLPLPRTIKEKEKAIEVVRLATGITENWSRRLLEDANFDIAKCIQTFVDLYKVDQIPVDAFKL